MRPFLIFLLSLFITSKALAASQWYQVELFAFAQEKPTTTERWSTNLLPHYSNNAVKLDSNYPQLPDEASDANLSALNGGAWQLKDIKPEDTPVSRMANRMRANRQYRILYEARWIQPIFSTVNALPINIEGGKSLPPLISEKPKQTSFGDNLGNEFDRSIEDDVADAMQFMPELQGTLLFSLQQYVHLSTNLWFASEAEGQPFFGHMDESRRLKNGELHYLDHPLFGLVVRVVRLKRGD